MKQLVIIGAGGFGREVYTWSQQSVGYNNEFLIKGFLDHDINKLDDFDYDVKILGSEDEYTIQDQDVFICAIGSPKIREKVSKKMIERGAIFTNIIHSSCVLSPNVQMGVGNIFAPFCLVSCDVKIENFNVFNGFVFVAHDVVVGNFNQIDAYAFCGGGVKIKDSCNIYPHSVLIPNVKLSNQTKIGAGSVMLRNGREDTTYFGLPARKTNL